MGSDIRITAEDLFHRAADLAVRERQVYLDRACEGNAALRREVEELLSFDEASGAFLEKPALQDAARELAGDLAKSRSLADTLDEEAWTLGPYRIRYQIGKGGMGIVYLALDTRDGREVALKVLPNDSDADEDRLARFTREGRMLSELKSLKHPNIAEIYEQAEYDGKPCIALEYVPGDTLADRLRQGPLPVSEALQYALQIAGALKSAHDRHIVHRDLKPANIKITPEGKIKVLDFGLAKRFYGEFQQGEEHNTRSLSLTESGMLLGTPAYMSPEQWNGQVVDQRADLWAFGCLLYEMLTGDPPFEGRNRAETMKAVFAANPDWSALPKNTPLAIQDLLRRCLERVPKQRLQDAGAVRQMLSQATGKNSFTPTLFLKSQVWRIRRYATSIALATAVMLCVTAAIWYWVRISEIPARKYLVVKLFEGFNNEQVEVGFAEELRRNLLNISDDLVVTHTTDLLQNSLLNVDLPTLQRKSGTNLTVQGKVQRTGDWVRIQFDVVNSFNYTVSNGEVEGTVQKLADLQYRIAEKIAEDLKLTKSSRGAEFSKHLNFSHADAAEQYLIAIGELQKDLNKESVDKPIQILEGLIQSDGDSARFRAALAQAYLNKYVFTMLPKWAEKALQSSEKAISLAPGQPEIYQVTRGLVLTRFGKQEEAINDFKAALERNPKDWEAWQGLALAYESSGRFLEAENAYIQAVNLWPNYWVGYNELGAFYYSQGRIEKAITSWQHVIRLLPDSPTGHNNIATAYYQRGQEADAINAYLTSISKDHTGDNNEAYAGLGTIYYDLGQHENAERYFLTGLDLVRQGGGQDAILLCNLADNYRQMGRRQAVPNRADEYNRRAAEAYDQAIGIYRQNVGNGIEDAWGLATLAELLAKRGNIVEAQQIIGSAVKINPNNAEVAYCAIVVHLLAGNTDQAFYWLERAACGSYSTSRLERDPELQDLQGTRFQTIIARCRQQDQIPKE
ncbi:MAG: protein kinase domain-containing protein [Blastocatellia bacterium]